MDKMRSGRISTKRGLFGACCLLIAGIAYAGQAPREGYGCDQRQHAPPGPPPAFGGFGEDHPPPYLVDAGLSDEQQDKVFAILHAAAPELREREKAARKAHEALRELGLSAAFDSAKASAMAQAQAAADSQVALIRARADHDIYLTLTPEQRARLSEHGSRPHDPPPTR